MRHTEHIENPEILVSTYNSMWNIDPQHLNSGGEENGSGQIGLDCQAL